MSVQDVYRFKDQHGHRGRLERRDDGELDMVIENGDGTSTRWSGLKMTSMYFEKSGAGTEDDPIQIIQDFESSDPVSE